MEQLGESARAVGGVVVTAGAAAAAAAAATVVFVPQNTGIFSPKVDNHPTDACPTCVLLCMTHGICGAGYLLHV